MSKRTVIEQLDAALSSHVEHPTVRVWVWITVVKGGSVRPSLLRSHFPDAKHVLVTGLRLGLFSVTKTEVRAREWPERDPTTETGEGSLLSSVGTFSSLRRNDSKENPSIEREMFRPKVSEAKKQRKRRKADAPVYQHLITLEGRERVAYALAHPRSPHCQAVIREATARVGRRYASMYHERTGRKYWESQVTKNARSFRMIAKWCTEQGLRYDEWFRWCDKFSRKNAVRKAFPAPPVCAGPWCSNGWIEERDGGPHLHAGHTYAEASLGLRKKLDAAGFDLLDIDDDMIEYLESSAREKTQLPDMYEPEANERYASIVDWIAENEVTSGDG